MGEDDGSLSVEDEIAPELTSVLTEMEIRDSSLQHCLAVEKAYLGMCVGSQERRPPQLEGSIRGPVRIEHDQEGETQSILKPRNALSGFK